MRKWRIFFSRFRGYPCALKQAKTLPHFCSPPGSLLFLQGWLPDSWVTDGCEGMGWKIQVCVHIALSSGRRALSGGRGELPISISSKRLVFYLFLWQLISTLTPVFFIKQIYLLAFLWSTSNSYTLYLFLSPMGPKQRILGILLFGWAVYSLILEPFVP